MKKRILAFFLLLAMLLSSCAHGEDANPIDTEPKIAQMHAICELAVMDCYYHCVAKYWEEDVSGILWWEKDKHFWIEYSVIVTLGLDISEVEILVDQDEIHITLPEAKILGHEVDSETLTDASYIVGKDSADVTAEDEVLAIAEAKKNLLEDVAADKSLLKNAQLRAKTLLEEYIQNIGDLVGKEYSIHWTYADSKLTETSQSTTSPPEPTAEETPS